MPNFICCKCGCIDNTACGGTYWITRLGGKLFTDPWFDTHPVCSECNTAEYSDGSGKGLGEWHGHFPKRHWSEIGTKADLSQAGVLNVESYFKEFVDNIKYNCNT